MKNEEFTMKNERDLRQQLSSCAVLSIFLLKHLEYVVQLIYLDNA